MVTFITSSPSVTTVENKAHADVSVQDELGDIHMISFLCPAASSVLQLHRLQPTRRPWKHPADPGLLHQQLRGFEHTGPNQFVNNNFLSEQMTHRSVGFKWIICLSFFSLLRVLQD